jgi:hypothetical protein
MGSAASWRPVSLRSAASAASSPPAEKPAAPISPVHAPLRGPAAHRADGALHVGETLDVEGVARALQPVLQDEDGDALLVEGQRRVHALVHDPQAAMAAARRHDDRDPGGDGLGRQERNDRRVVDVEDGLAVDLLGLAPARLRSRRTVRPQHDRGVARRDDDGRRLGSGRRLGGRRLGGR